MMESYIDCKKKLYNTILEFLEELDEINQQNHDGFYDNLSKFHIEGDREEMTQFLLIIKSISDHHHRDENFIQKIKEIIQHYKEQIKQTLSNDEIFHIFRSNKLIVLFLLKNDIIHLSEFIYDSMISKIEPNGNRYCHFFYPELEQFKGEKNMEDIKEDLLSNCPTAFEEFESKRQEGENDSHICSLIRKDSVEEFITYINRNNISISSVIKPSIFETNLLIIENKNTTLIEYSAFFGSIQIFRYLLMSNVELKPSLWLYSIHSKNAELIHLLESNEIKPPKLMNNKSKDFTENIESNKIIPPESIHILEEDDSYLCCLVESIKCHHNDFSEYIENNLIQV